MDSLNAGHLQEGDLQKEQEYMRALLNKCRDAQSTMTLKLAKNLKCVIFAHLAEAKAMLQSPRDSCLLGCDQKYLLLKLEMHCLYLSLAEIHLLSHSSHYFNAHRKMFFSAKITSAQILRQAIYTKSRPSSILLVTTI